MPDAATPTCDRDIIVTVAMPPCVTRFARRRGRRVTPATRCTDTRRGRVHSRSSSSPSARTSSSSPSTPSSSSVVPARLRCRSSTSSTSPGTAFSTDFRASARPCSSTSNAGMDTVRGATAGAARCDGSTNGRVRLTKGRTSHTFVSPTRTGRYCSSSTSLLL